MQINQYLKDNSFRLQKTVRVNLLKVNMVPTKELSVKTMKEIVKLIQEGIPQWSVVKDVSCSQSVVCKNSC